MAQEIGSVLLCDGTREGLLTALFYAEALRPKASDILVEPPAQCDLFEPPQCIPAEWDKAERVWEAIGRKLHGDSPWVFESVSCSGEANRGGILLRYLRRGWQVGNLLHHHLADPDVFAALRLSQQVGHEIHRMKGLVRFARAGEVYYAAMETDHDIVELLAPHFADRLGDQSWILHDTRRGKAAVYRAGGGQWMCLPLEREAKADVADPFEGLWRAYHKTIAIGERVNPGLQRQHMPRRYWAHLPEMQQGG